MVTLNNRQKQILNLLEKKADYITISYISEFFDVSPRTVRNDLDNIEELLKKHDSRIERKPRAGIKLILKRGKYVQNFLNENDLSNYSSEERVLIIILLVVIKGKATIEELAQDIQVSKNTLVQDFKLVVDKLSQYDISVSKKVYHGITIDEKEEKVRAAFFSIYNKSGKMLKQIIKNKLLGITGITQSSIIEKIEQLEQKFGTLYSQESIEELECMILLSMCRSKLGFKVQYTEDERQYLGKRREFEILRGLMDLDDDELCYLLKIADGSRRAIGGEANSITEEILDELCETLNIDRIRDLEFTSQIAMHLKVAISRIQNNLVIENPILDEIKYKMSFIYKITEQILNGKKELIGVSFPEEEIAYIAMYFDAVFEKSIKEQFDSKILVVCNGGLATSSLLKARINSMIPEAEITSICRLSDVEKVLAQENIDFIVTTIPITVNGYLVIRVNALLSPEDIDKIKKEIYEKRHSKKFKYHSKAVKTFEESEMSKLFPEKLVQFEVETKDWKIAIKLAVKPLLDAKKITKYYSKEIIKVVESLGNYMVFIPGIAFVHAPAEHVIENSMSLLLLEEEINFGSSKEVPVKAIVVLANKTENMYLVNLVNILTKNDNISKFKNAKSYDEIADID
ncbi:MAG: BglG family transcription antiterminator [Proteocatella sp.]